MRARQARRQQRTRISQAHVHVGRALQSALQRSAARPRPGLIGAGLDVRPGRRMLRTGLAWPGLALAGADRRPRTGERTNISGLQTITESAHADLGLGYGHARRRCREREMNDYEQLTLRGRDWGAMRLLRGVIWPLSTRRVVVVVEVVCVEPAHPAQRPRPARRPRRPSSTAPWRAGPRPMAAARVAPW